MSDAPSVGIIPGRMSGLFIEYIKTDRRFFFAVVITVVISITLHELSHGIIAIWRGDRTPIDEGHMTLNPAVHMGLISIIALLLAGIAWGAMPIDPTRIRGRFGEALVAVAGPVSNVILALLSLTALGLWWRYEGHGRPLATPLGNLQFLLTVFGWMNLSLAMFNLLPIPPLDGAKVLENLVPRLRTVFEHLSTGGGSMIVFLIAFASAGTLIFPAAAVLQDHWLTIVSGMAIGAG
jgi:Zn-dependent protease